MAKPQYTKEDKDAIKKLKAAGKELTGEESSDELKTLLEAQEAEDRDEVTEAEEVDGIPNKLAPRTEALKVANKDVNLPVFFVATVKGGKQALYDYQGKRVSPAYGPEDRIDPSNSSSELGVKYINKAAAKFNAMRRKNIIPGEAQIG